MICAVISLWPGNLSLMAISIFYISGMFNVAYVADQALSVLDGDEAMESVCLLLYACDCEVYY